MITAPPVSSGRPGKEAEVEPGVLLRRRERVSSQLSPPHPQHRQYQPPSACLRGRPLLPASPRRAQLPRGANATWLFFFPQNRFQKQNLCPPLSTSLPQVPWEESREPPWLLIHPAASPRSPHPTWGSRAPPCQRPHPGSEAAGCHFQHLHRASHSFPRKWEEDFQGPKSKSVQGLQQLAYLLPKQPDSPSSPQAPWAKGERRAEPGAGTGSLPPRRSPLRTAPAQHSFPSLSAWT